tara:strand:- start:538 stop:1227 length:690 start_codon:yes stop_codon:yes gene_type:complete
MIRRILGVAVLTGLALTMSVPAQADISIGADVVNQYVWRGAACGNAVSIQPGIDYDTGVGVNIGAWSSVGHGGQCNENDLYVSYSPTDQVSIMITDYYYNPHKFLDYASDGSHVIEASVSVDLGTVNVLGGINLHGDNEPAHDDHGDDDHAKSKSRNSFYAEIGLPLSALSSNGNDVSLSVGVGDGAYTSDGDPTLVVLSLNVSNDDYSASYIVNPDSELSWLVFGKSF